MKKLIALLLACLMLVSLCACAPKEKPSGSTAPSGTLPGAQTDPSNGGESDPTEPQADPLELAKSCIDKPVSELYALIGEPSYADYAPSCLVDGEDGELHYDGFIVYTLKTAEGETVYSVSEE